jgi:hypothetical protein
MGEDVIATCDEIDAEIVRVLTFVCKRLAVRGPVPGRSGAGSGPKPCQDGSILARWITVLTVIRKLAVLVYASSAKRTASTRPGPFFGTVFFLDRGLMMLIAEASSCVFKCAA